LTISSLLHPQIPSSSTLPLLLVLLLNPKSKIANPKSIHPFHVTNPLLPSLSCANICFQLGALPIAAFRPCHPFMNLEEIARLTGVSRSTVSRVVNNDPNVRAATRQRVLQVIEQVNYHPNVAARSLAAGRTHVLGLVIPMLVSTLFVDPYFAQLIQGVAAACNEQDYSVMLWLAEPEYERRTIHKIMGSGLIDGVIVASTLTRDPLIETLLSAAFPFVLVGRYPGHYPISYVDVENERGAYEAVCHLLTLGRRRIATITGPLNMIAGLDRRNGYLAVLQEQGIAADPCLIVESDFSEEGGYQAMQQLLPHQPDAVFVASDTMAQGALQALREAGRSVPQDVALVGFDDMPLAAHTTPPLTTVRQPSQRTGRLAAGLLIDLLHSLEAAPRHLILNTELIIRHSCGAREHSHEN
jgi:LacI family transcriptional regulator